MAITKVVNIKVQKTGDNVVKDLNKDLKQTNKEIQDTNQSLDHLTGGAVTRFKGLKTGVTSAIRSFKSLRVAIIGTGIGALLIGVLAVKEAFTSSEEGQNKFAKIMGVIGSITGNLSDLLSDLGEKIISVFENPKQALIDFADAFKKNIVNRFTGFLNLIPRLGKAVVQFFEGDFTGAAETAANAVGQVVLGVEDIVQKTKDATEAAKEYSKQIQEDARIAGNIADERAKADKIERGLIVERAEANRDIAKLRDIAARRDLYNLEQRRDALVEAGEINEDIAEKEIVSAKLRRDAIIEENKLSKSTKEDLEEEARLRARVIELETAKLNLQKRIGTELSTLNEQARNENLKRLEEEKAEELRIETEGAVASKKLEEETEQAEIDAEDRRLQRKFKDLETTKQVEDAKGEIQKSSLASAFGLLQSFAGDNKDIQKGLLIAENATGIADNIINTNAANATLTAQLGVAAPPAIAANFTRMGIGIASSIAATTKGLSALGGGSPGGSVTTPTSATAPTFNLSSPETNQIADTISNTNDKPVQAFVVGSAVTSSQELDRNKFDEGSI